MSPNPPTEQIPWTHVAPLAQWTVPFVTTVLAAFEDGEIGEAASLAEAMLRDPQIAKDLRALVDQIASRSALPFTVEPSDADGRRVQAVADHVQRLWWEAHPESTLAPIVRDSKMLAVSVGWVEWLRDAQWWIPRLHHLPAHGLRFQDSDKTIHYQGGDGVDHLVTPGDGLWFLHMPHGDRSWMMGAVRPLGIPFALDPLCLRAFANFCQRNGFPVLAIDEPFWATDDVENQAATAGNPDASAKAFYARVEQGVRKGILRLPQGREKELGGWAAKWLELVGKSYASFTDLLAELRRRKSLAMRGRDSEQQGSLGGDGEANDATQQVEGLASECEKLSTSLRDQVWKPFARFNYGDERLAPWGRWNTQPPANLSARASTLDKFGDALAKLEQQGVDTDPILAEAGLKRRAGWKPPDTNAPPPATPAKNEDDPNSEETKQAA